jgi:hypothetical protein
MHVIDHHMHLSSEAVETPTTLATPEELLEDLSRVPAAEVVAAGRLGTGGSEDGGEPISALKGHWGFDMSAEEGQVGDEVAPYAHHLVAH